MKRYVLNSLMAVAMVAMMLSLSSCSYKYRKYESPTVEAEGLFREETPVDTTTIADIPWRDYFTDPILLGYIEEGLVNNFDLRIAYTRIQQAESNLRMARSAYFPTVALAGNVQHNRQSIGASGRDVLGYNQTTYSLGISASWEADIWGKLSRQKRSQYAAFLNSQAYRDLIQTSLVANIATTYYSLMALDEQLKITRRTVELLRETTTTMQALMDAGVLNGAAVQQSLSLLYSTMVMIPDLESGVRETENALCQLMGRQPGPVVRSSLDQQQVVGLMDHGVPVQMLSRRPDVRQAELNFRSAYELTGAARSAMYPSITLNSGSFAGLGAATLSNFFKPENIIANILGGITMPLFAGRQLKSNFEMAQARQQEALIGFESAVLNAGVEVSNILYGYSSSLGKNQVREQQLEALNTAVYFTKELLVAGEADYTEVLTAEQNLLSARLSSVNDKLEQLQYSVNLYKALGGGTF